jgi:hypothetical protein
VGGDLSMRDDDATRCDGQGLRSTATGGWHGGIDIGVARSKAARGSE